MHAQTFISITTTTATIWTQHFWAFNSLLSTFLFATCLFPSKCTRCAWKKRKPWKTDGKKREQEKIKKTPKQTFVISSGQDFQQHGHTSSLTTKGPKITREVYLSSEEAALDKFKRFRIQQLLSQHETEIWAAELVVDRRLSRCLCLFYPHGRFCLLCHQWLILHRST